MGNSYSDITAVILAGGLGTRLRSEVADRSKVVVEVGERPFITRIFDQLIGVGIRRAVLCTGYKAEGVEGLLGDRYGNLELVYSPEIEPLGTAGALRNALELLDTSPLLVLNGDSYFSGNLLELLDFHHKNDAFGSIMLCYMEDVASYGQVRVDDSGVIGGFEEKSGKAEPGWVNAGLYLLRKEWIESISIDRKVSLEAGMFPHWIGQGLYGLQAEGRLLDIGTPERYRLAEQYFASLDED